MSLRTHSELAIASLICGSMWPSVCMSSPLARLSVSRSRSPSSSAWAIARQVAPRAPLAASASASATLAGEINTFLPRSRSASVVKSLRAKCVFAVTSGFSIIALNPVGPIHIGSATDPMNKGVSL